MRAVVLSTIFALSLGPVTPAQTRPAAPAATQASTDISSEIESLVPLLASDEWAVRQNAQDKLVRMGEIAKPRLAQVAREAKDAETRTRAEAAIALIDENRLTGASLITLHATAAPPSEIVNELSRQALTSLKVMPDELWSQRDWPRVTIDADKQPFWLVLRDLCKQAGVRVQYQGGDRGLVLYAAGGSDPFDAPASYSGPFLVLANSASQTNSINFGQFPNAVPQVTRSLHISFMVYAEPKLQILGHSYMARLIEASDDKGHSLLGPRQYNDYNADGSVAWNISAMLNMPKDAGTRIVKLKGSTRVVLQTQAVTWEITDILTARRRTKYINGRLFAYNEINQSDGGYNVKLTITRDPALNVNYESYAGLNSIQLVDDKGRPFSRRGNNASAGADPTRIEYTLNFAKTTDEDPTTSPAKLIWKLPLETRDIDIPFEFRDLPLP